MLCETNFLVQRMIIKNNHSHLRICENNYSFSGHVSVLKNVSQNNPEHVFLSFSQENLLFPGENFMGGLRESGCFASRKPAFSQSTHEILTMKKIFS